VAADSFGRIYMGSGGNGSVLAGDAYVSGTSLNVPHIFDPYGSFADAMDDPAEPLSAPAGVVAGKEGR
jgi:hypothetical protein